MTTATAADAPTADLRGRSADDDQYRILLVDDEPALLSSLRRQLSRWFRVETLDDPLAVLDRIRELDDLAVVVSDMRMPGMDGVTLLSRIHDEAPDVTRVLLTGYAEVDVATAAVNEGRVFRFLSKPIAPDLLRSSLVDAVRQHRLVVAERELLERTLRGSVKALVDTLAMANPTAFARATRIRSRVEMLAGALDLPDRWDIEVAGMLTHIAAIELPPGVNDRLHRGQELTERQVEAVEALPAQSVALIAGIPRLEGVRQIIGMQRQRFDGRGPVVAGVAGDDIPLGARMLRVATDYDRLEARGTSVQRAVAAMRERAGVYDPEMLDALETALAASGERETRYVGISELRPGDVLARDLETKDGTLLVSRGQELTQRIIGRVTSWASHTTIAEPVAVLSPATEDAA